MTTTLKLQSRNGHNSTYTVPAVHTAVSPKLVIQKRKVPSGNQRILEDTISVVDATEDANDVILDVKDSITVVLRRDKHGKSANWAATLARFRDVVAGDEFGAVATSQDNLI
jgi:hypothetical protein